MRVRIADPFASCHLKSTMETLRHHVVAHITMDTRIGIWCPFPRGRSSMDFTEALDKAGSE